MSFRPFRRDKLTDMMFLLTTNSSNSLTELLALPFHVFREQHDMLEKKIREMVPKTNNLTVG